MKNLKIWVKAVRAPFFTASMAPVILGAAVAWNRFYIFNLFLFLLTLLGAVLIHGGINLSNDYFDFKSGADQKNLHPTPFSGGSRVIQEGLLSSESIFKASVTLIFLGGLIGIYLNYACGSNVILYIGLTGVFLGFFYTAAPLRLGYHGLGEAAVAIGFGPLIVLGSFFVQVRAISFAALFSSIPVAILIGLVLFINEFPDYDPDKRSHKRNLVVILGKEKAKYVYIVCLLLCYLIVVIGVGFKIIPFTTLIIFLTFPLAIKAILILLKQYDKIYELVPVNLATVRLHMVITTFLAIGFLFGKRH